jgi:hypothetical protein
VRSEVLYTESGGKEYPTYNKTKANWNGHILHRNCLLKHVIEGQTEGKTEVTGRRQRRSKYPLDDLKEKSGYCKLNEEALYRTLWRIHFGRGWICREQSIDWVNE